jgi:uncharacterized membrane protein
MRHLIATIIALALLPGAAIAQQDQGSAPLPPALGLPVSFDQILPDDLAARGNEPFWLAHVRRDRMVIRRLDQPDLDLSILAIALDRTGAVTITTAQDAGMPTAVMVRTPSICHDTMAGLPYPETVTLAVAGDRLAGCGGDPLALLLGRDWQVDLGATPALMTFHPDGQLTGAGGCNRWFAAYRLTGEALNIGPAGATRMACAPDLMQQDSDLWARLAEVAGFDIIAPDGAAPDRPMTLVLLSADGTALIRASGLPAMQTAPTTPAAP